MVQMKKDLISVIVPVYNTEEYLSQCLESILASTYQNLEVICVDDASVDFSLDILNRYAQMDSRIVVIPCEQNGGQAAARNKALDAAKGDYYAFVDSDDFVSGSFFEELYRCLIKEKSDVAVCGFREFDELTGEQREEVLQTEKSPLTEKEWWEQYRHKHTVYMNCVCNKLFRADCFTDKRFSQGIIYEDTNLQHYLMQNKTISVIQKSLYYYRRRADSTTKSKHSRKSFSRVQSLIDRAGYFAAKDWNLAKVHTLQDAIKFIYQATYNSELEKKEAKLISKGYRQTIQKMMYLQDWFSIKQKGQCWMILYVPGVYHILRKSIGQ